MFTGAGGKGTVVCRRRPEDSLEPFVSFSSELINRGVEPGTDLLEWDQRQPSPEVSSILGMEQGAEVLYFKRLRRANQIPVAVEESYLRPEEFGKLDPEKLSGSFLSVPGL